ncbi:MAG: mercury resistance system periplasmic binding protein MerP [Gammaproteobacteria bacterium]|nr:mercury resistance system periplasmic binding protein MerP [Gammaproteobacteria bacterium]
MLKKLLATCSLFTFVAAPAFAATQSITLAVPTMTCAACPITVKQALLKTEGVLEARVSWEPKEAVVTYDDSRTNPQALAEATAKAGYPSTIVQVKP